MKLKFALLIICINFHWIENIPRFYLRSMLWTSIVSNTNSLRTHASDKVCCTTIHRYPIFSMRYSVMCKVYTGYHGTGEMEHGLCVCTVDNPLAKARGLSLRTGAQTMLYLSLVRVFNFLRMMDVAKLLDIVLHNNWKTKSFLQQPLCFSNISDFCKTMNTFDDNS